MRIPARASLSTLFAVLTTTCGTDEVAEPAPLGEVCGQQGPFRLLELPPDQVAPFPALPVGDRLIHLVREHLADQAPDPTTPAYGESTVWSTGPCGESPKQVASAIRYTFTIDAWPNEALGCTEDGDVVRLDPLGEAPPHVVFSDVGSVICGLGWTPHGLLSMEDHGDLGTLLLHPYAADPRDDPPEPRVLLEGIPITNSGRGGQTIVGYVLATFDEFVLAIDAADTMVRIELATGEVTQLQPDVLGFDASRDGRWFKWQDAKVVDGDDPWNLIGDVFLRDQADGSDTFLAETSLRFTLGSFWSVEQGLLLVSLGDLATGPQRFFRVPGVEYFDTATTDAYLSARLDEQRWFVSYLSTGYQDVLDLQTHELTRISPREGDVKYRTADAIDLLEAPRCCIVGSFRDSGPIWRLPLDGSEPSKLVEQATRYMARLSDGRYFGPSAIDAGWLAPLVLTDPAKGTEQLVDDRVFAASIDRSRIESDSLVTYTVSDGDRSGIYLARLPASERSHAATPAGEAPPIFDVMPGPDGRPELRPREEHPLDIQTLSPSREQR